MAEIIHEDDSKLEFVAEGWDILLLQNLLGVPLIFISIMAVEIIYLSYLEIGISQQLIAYSCIAGLLYLAAIWLCLTQTIIRVDTESSSVSLFWRSWVTVNRRSMPFSSISGMHLSHELKYAGKGQYLSTFPIRLILAQEENVELTKELDLFHARKIASRIAKLCKVPFEDQTLQITEKLLPRDVRSAFKMVSPLTRSKFKNLRTMHLFTAFVVFLLSSGLVGILVHLFTLRSQLFPIVLCLGPWGICAVALFLEGYLKAEQIGQSKGTPNNRTK